MRIVGTSQAGIEHAPVSPQEAWARGRVLDAMLPSTVVVPRGVSRLTHAQRNALDDARMVEVARRLNTPGLDDRCVISTPPDQVLVGT